MGKIKTEKKPRKNLADDIIEKDVLRPSRRGEKPRGNRKDNDEQFVGKGLSKKILDEARIQQDELEEEYGITGQPKRKRKDQKPAMSNSLARDRLKDDELSNDEDEYHDEEFLASEDQYAGECELDREDEEALDAFMTKEPAARKTLADIIMEKLNEKKTEVDSQFSVAEQSKPALDDKVVSCFKTVGKILSKYRSGKLPKAFKIIPSLANWEEILYLTEPDNWTAAAIYQATRIFASNLNAKLAQRYYNLVLYPRVRDDIAEYKRLNYHLYMSLKKALFKPAAFFKGILLPLCQSGTCTLREAVIVGSVVTKCSIPSLHSSAALLKIAEMDYNGANSLFLRLLIEKKYALPYRVIDAVVFHFVRFLSDTRDMPVLWYQALLRFVQIYKEDISSEQKDAMGDLCRKHNHDKITPSIRWELTNSKSRDTEDAQPATMDED